MIRAEGFLAWALALAIAGMAGVQANAAAETQSGSEVAVPNPPQLAHQFPVERTISLKHHWTREELTIVYRIGDDYQPQAMAAINHLMRDYRCKTETQIDPKLVDLLYELQQELDVRGPIRVISAFRSEGHNASLLRAGRTVDPDSQHTRGHAADVIFPGVKADRLKAVAEAKGIGGVGYYPFSGPVFVHLDTGPVRHWVETDPKERRALGLAMSRRSRFVLDCSLTRDKVLAEISAERAYAALPQGASSKPDPEIEELRTALAAGSAAFGPLAHQRGAANRAAVNIQEEDGPACFGWEPLASLSLLPESPSRMESRPRERQKAKVKAQIKDARRSARNKGRNSRKEARADDRRRKK
jgi:uncharacterized protein YcbK (DUF882 family)